MSIMTVYARALVIDMSGVEFVSLFFDRGMTPGADCLDLTFDGKG